MRLWLDDIRNPLENGAIGFTWVKTADEAIFQLSRNNSDELMLVTFASLDHDLAPEHYPWNENWAKSLDPKNRPKDGYEVVLFMEQTGRWPKDGVRVHSMNPVGRARMEQVVKKHYGRNF